MEFFYDQFLKLKNNVLIIIVIMLLVVINDFGLYYIMKPKNITNDNKNNQIALTNFDDKKVEEVEEVKFKVDVKGEVKKPGVYEVSSLMNVSDVIGMAGGLTKKATTSTINLSKQLHDQMVIIVPNKDEIKKSVVTSTANCNLKEKVSSNDQNVVSNIKNDVLITQEDLNNSADLSDTSNDKTVGDDLITSSNTLISINNASLSELMNIPGIGESKAKKIIEYRENNCFNTIEDIKNVSGIGDSVFEKIKNYITI